MHVHLEAANFPVLIRAMKDEILQALLYEGGGENRQSLHAAWIGDLTIVRLTNTQAVLIF